MNRIVLIAIVSSLIGLHSPTVSAAEPQIIDWKDLLPVKVVEDPFEKLSRKQLDDLGVVARIRRLITAGKINPDGASAKEATQIEERLKNAGIDTTWLLSQRAQVGRLREIQTQSVQPRVENKIVQLAGFIVPLKQSGKLVTEFVLVPTFDSCRDSAPLPPNQTVYVQSDEGIACEGPVTAVRVTGQIQAKQHTGTLLRAKGPTRIVAAYAIAPLSIEIWQAKESGGKQTTARHDVSRIEANGTE